MIETQSGRGSIQLALLGSIEMAIGFSCFRLIIRLDLGPVWNDGLSQPASQSASWLVIGYVILFVFLYTLL